MVPLASVNLWNLLFAASQSVCQTIESSIKYPSRYGALDGFIESFNLRPRSILSCKSLSFNRGNLQSLGSSELGIV